MFRICIFDLVNVCLGVDVNKGVGVNVHVAVGCYMESDVVVNVDAGVGVFPCVFCVLLMCVLLCFLARSVTQHHFAFHDIVVTDTKGLSDAHVPLQTFSSRTKT